MPPKARPKKASSRKMPPPLPKGEVLVDGIMKQEWIIGQSIGKGGFGEIYTAALKGKDLKDAQHVIKIEPHENGPLFSELSYYRRAARSEMIDDWIKKMKVNYLPIPKYITSGCHDFKGVKYRFMVMKRFGDDIHKHFTAAGRNFCDETICYLALRLLEGLQFLHESEYVHADIKGSNLLTGRGNEAGHVYLVDYGLAFRYMPEGVHKLYEEDPKRCHDGTIEFTSIDAHKGVYPSRRADLEILGYCLLQWGCGKLPWEDNLGDANYVARTKMMYKENVEKLITDCFVTRNPKFLLSYMKEVYKLGYSETPNYPKLMKIFTDQLRGCDPTETLEWLPGVKKNVVASTLPVAADEPEVLIGKVKVRPVKAHKRGSSDLEDGLSESPPKRARRAPPAKRVCLKLSRRSLSPRPLKLRLDLVEKRIMLTTVERAGGKWWERKAPGGRRSKPVLSMEEKPQEKWPLPREKGRRKLKVKVSSFPRSCCLRREGEKHVNPGGSRNQNKKVDYTEAFEEEKTQRRRPRGKRNHQESDEDGDDEEDGHNLTPRSSSRKRKRRNG